MANKKTININKKIVNTLIFGLVLAFMTVFIVEHYGKVTFIADTTALIEEQRILGLKNEREYNEALRKQINGQHLSLVDYGAIADHRKTENEGGFAFRSVEVTIDTPLLSIFLETPFGSKLRISGEGYVVGDVWTQYGSFNDYSNKFKYYIMSALDDYKYILLLGFGYFLLIIEFTRFKIKLI